MTRYRVGGLMLLLAVTYLIGEAVAVAGWQGRPYQWTRDAISALGVPEPQVLGAEVGRSTRHVLMNATFVLTGLRAAVAAVLLAPFAPRKGRAAVLVLVGLYSLGIVLVGLFPTGPTAVRNAGHGLGAVLVIVGGAVLLLALTAHLARPHPRLAVLTGICALTAVIGCVGTSAWPDMFGLFERMAVDAVIVWQIIAGAAVLASRPPRQRGGA